MANERWKVEQSFGDEPVLAVVGPRGDAQAPLSDAEILAIAARSKVPYWTDGKRLFTIEGYALASPDLRPIAPLDALRAFGLEQLLEAREYGSTFG
jgi:hypothetical protein